MQRSRCHHPDSVFRVKDPIHDPDQHHHTDIVVEPGVNHKRLQRGFGIAFGRRNSSDNGLKNLVDSHASFGAGRNRIRRIEPDDILDFFSGSVRISLRQIHFVQNRNNFDAEIQSGITVGNRLCFDALGRIDHQ